VRVTSKGQVTIPRDVRRPLGIAPGTDVTFEVVGDHAQLRPAQRSMTGRGQRLIDALAGTADPGVTTEEIMAMTRGWDDDDPGRV
jgi:AbrB family looped-hinge helix DNA binding protein